MFPFDDRTFTKENVMSMGSDMGDNPAATNSIINDIFMDIGLPYSEQIA